jgi:hypothetical protein
VAQAAFLELPPQEHPILEAAAALAKLLVAYMEVVRVVLALSSFVMPTPIQMPFRQLARLPIQTLAGTRPINSLVAGV